MPTSYLPPTIKQRALCSLVHSGHCLLSLPGVDEHCLCCINDCNPTGIPMSPSLTIPQSGPVVRPRPAGRSGLAPEVAVIGCGYWGRNLVRVFHGLRTLRAVCDASPAGIDAAHQIARDVRLLADFNAILDDPTIDAVVIATPAETHATLASQALSAGKHVFVEKPLALTYRDGANLVRQAEAAGLVLMVGHILEYHPAVVELVRRVRRGELGKVQYVYSNRLNLGKVRREENILWSFAPHDIAVMLRIIGESPLEVTATGGAYLQPNIADVTVTTLHFDRGVRGHIFVSWLHPYKEQRLVVVGSSRMAVLDDVAREQKLVIYDQGIDWIDGQPVPRKKESEIVTLSADEPLRAEAEHFLQAIMTGEQPLTDGASGLRVLQVLQAAQRSLGLHGQPVGLGGSTE
jgi:predicted dehydrogenase